MTTLKKASLLATIGLLLVPAAVSASSEIKSVVHSTNGNVVRSTDGNCVITQWDAKSNECGMQITEEMRNVFFDFNKSTLNAKEKAKLDTVAKLIKGSKEVASIDIVGYADKIGKPSYNKALSAKRAAAVKNYLAAKGLKTRKLTVESFGDTKPVTNCSSSMAKADLISCLAEDRRVEIKLNLKK